ncbi:MAG TPA: hypothetical protein VJT50_02390 [Pyrinomonadaceae bacterium]|nr:hypothetical protein [Pyrinomonadaceae bacterium]
MSIRRLFCFGLAGLFLVLCLAGRSDAQSYNEEYAYGPVVRAYLGYLRNEQEVVDDRASRHEVTPGYYRRNSNRIRALRQMATQIARETQNDYLPELEAVSADEFGLLFERPPQVKALRVGEVFRTTFRYLGLVRSGEVFYVFARLDPYEQSELMARESRTNAESLNSEPGTQFSGAKTITRARRVTPR